jgi:hypothetical protein
MELNQRKQQFMANKLTSNIINHNTSRDTYDSFRYWLLNIGKFEIDHNKKQIHALSFLGIGLCWGSCYNLIDVNDIVLGRNTKWYTSQNGGWNIYDTDTNQKIFTYPDFGCIATCDGCKERTKIKKQQEQKKQLKKLMKKSRCNEDICCSICIENIETNTHQIKLKCSHRFHPDCITQWTNRKTSCPYCRKDIIPPVVSH